MKKNVYIIFLCFALTKVFAQHQQFYSQYVYSGLLINPAYAGSQDALSFTTIVKKQWVGLQGTPNSLNFALHTPLRQKTSNIGLAIVSDKIGITTSNQLSGVYAYKLKIKKSVLSLGLKAELEIIKNDWSLIKTTTENDPTFTSQVQVKYNPNFGAGAYYYTKNLFAGISFPTLYNLGYKELNKFNHANIYGGYLISATTNFKLKPSVLIKYIKNSPIQYDITNTFYVLQNYGIGVGYRSNDAIYFYLDLKLNNQINVGYAYDYTLTKIKNYTHGSHEIMLRYLFNYKINSKSVRYF